MLDLALRRKMAKDSIAINPTEVIITRSAKTKNKAGGYDEGPIDLPPQIVRIFLNNPKLSTKTTEGGEVQKKTYGMLADYEADIQKDDEFEGYKVVDVTPIKYKGEIVSYQCKIEVV